MKTHTKLPSQQELLETFSYDQSTGVLTRIKTKAGHPWNKKVNTKKGKTGYVLVGYNYTLYRANRLIWMMVTGEDPGEMFVDHINRDTSDNRMENLRLVDRSENNLNRRGWAKN